MRRKILQNAVCLLWCVFWLLPAYSSSKAEAGDVSQQENTLTHKITIVDMGGRKVTIPRKIKSVLSRCPIGTLLMYSVNSAKIAGQNWTPTENEKKFLNSDFLNLPILSGWYADGKVGNIEEIVKVAPDIIFSSFFKNPSAGVIDQADRIQEQLQIPVVLIDSSFESLPRTYEFVGDLVNERERSLELGRYISDLLADVRSKAAMIDEDAKVTIYYAEGIKGLQTDPSGSWHTRVIDFINAINVAQVEIQSGMGRSTVSPEQLLRWNPDVIIACHDQGFANEKLTYQAVLNDGRFRTLAAISNNRVYEVPYKPFNFIDRPPSINRLIGLKWLGNLIYPKVFRYDMNQETKEFYKVFYNIDLSQEQLDDIFKYSK